MSAERPPATASDEATRLQSFVRRVEAGQRRRTLWTAGLGIALPLATAVALVLLWSPFAASLALWVVLAVVAVRLLLLSQRGHRRPGILNLRAAAPRLADELATWDEVTMAGTGAPAMVRWLGTDLVRDVSELPQQPRRLLPSARLGRVRYLLPLLVVLLLLWLWLPTLPIPGLRGGGGAGGGAGSAGSGPQAAGGGDRSAQNTDPVGDVDRGQQRDRPPLPPPPPAPELPPQPQQLPPPEPPAPLLELPSLPTVVVPDFIGDGATRRAMAERALVPANDDAPAGAGAGDRDDPRSPPIARREEFARAAERAFGSRHVPPAEREIVRRYFELLQQDGK